MMALNHAIMALFVAPVSAAWQTVYSSNFSVAYIQSVNGSLFKLPISDQNATTSELVSNLKQIASAPSNSSIVLDRDGHLFAVWGSKGCGQSPIEISEYHPQNDQWLSIGQSDMKTQKWYQESQIVWLDRSTDQIYIYGGACEGATESGFYRYTLSNNSFDSISAEDKVMPRPMSAAQAIPLSDYETLIVGGRSGNAWMSMQQMAVWGHGSWVFDSVTNSTGIDSRENPLLLPIWRYGQNGTADTITEILVAGGTVAGRTAKPDLVTLKYTNTEGWFWTIPDDDMNIDLSFAASTLYATLATINKPSNPDTASSSSGSSPASSSSSSSNGVISLYDQGVQNKWAPVQSVSVAKPAAAASSPSASPTSQQKSHSTSTATIAVVSTLLPIIVISLLAIAGWWWWHKRRQRRLFLLPNREGMLRRQHSTNSSIESSNYWSSTSAQVPISSSIPPIPHPENGDSGSIMMMESSEGNRLFMSKQRRSLRVVNPDNDDLISNVGSANHSREQSREKVRHLSADGSIGIDDTLMRGALDYIINGPREDKSREGSRESSWSSSSRVNPFSDNAERRDVSGNGRDRADRSEFDFGM